MSAGARIALGADDPLLFGSRLAAQYSTMRAAHDLTDAQLAALARSSIDASRADDATKSGLLAEIERWCDTIPT
jgi:adenosine deaminase